MQDVYHQQFFCTELPSLVPYRQLSPECMFMSPWIHVPSRLFLGARRKQVFCNPLEIQPATIDNYVQEQSSHVRMTRNHERNRPPENYTVTQMINNCSPLSACERLANSGIADLLGILYDLASASNPSTELRTSRVKRSKLQRTKMHEGGMCVADLIMVSDGLSSNI